MKKKDVVSLILSTIGGIVFALGMCMALIPEWGAIGPGIVVGCVGLVLLLALIPMVKIVGGDIAVKSVVGKGSTFVVRLKSASGDHRAAPAG